jgi:peptidoglycan biosynthesis protein MviN/MurJ (putative lipid II flippase)
VTLLSDGPTARVLLTVGIAGLLALATGIAVPSTATVGAGLALLGSQYVLHLVLDKPPADAQAAVVATALLGAGELAFWSIALRRRGPREPGRHARRLAFELALVLAGLVLAAVVLALADMARVSGAGIELVGGAAAAGLLGLTVLALRPGP